MTTDLDRSASDFGTALALLVALAAVAVVAATAGSLAPAALGVAGALCLARSAGALVDGSNDHRAAGSVGIVVAVLLIVGALALAVVRERGAVLFLAATGAVAAAGLGTVVDEADEADEGIERVIHRSIAVLVLAAVVAGIHHGRLPTEMLLGGIAVVRAVASASALVAFIVLQIEALLVVLALPPVLELLDDWVPGGAERVPSPIHRMGLRIERVPRAYWLLLGAQIFVGLFPDGSAWFAWFLSKLSLLGVVIDAALRSGLLHLLLAAFGVALLAIALARLGHETFLLWAGDDPPEAFADATGGVVAVAVVALSVAIPPVAAVMRANGLSQLVGDVGPGAAVLCALAVGLAACLVVQYALRWAWHLPVVPNVAGGFALACALLFVATVAGAERGSPGLAVFVGVAAAVLVWDLGENATGLGREVGRRAETRRTEVVHATGSVLVGVAGVVLATVATGLLGGVSGPSERWQALLALALVLVALLSFIGLLGDERLK